MAEWIDINENLKMRMEVQLVQLSIDGKKYNLFTDDFLNFLKKDKGSITIPEVSSKGFITLNREDFGDCHFYYSIFEKRKEEILTSLEERYHKKFEVYNRGNIPNHKKKDISFIYGRDVDDIEEENEDECLKDLGDYCYWNYKSE